MHLDDRFADLVLSLGGFYRTWFVYVGLELGLFARLARAGSEGLEPAVLAADTGTDRSLVERCRDQGLHIAPRALEVAV